MKKETLSNTSVGLYPSDHKLAKRAAKKLGISKNVFIQLAIREKAEKVGVVLKQN